MPLRGAERLLALYQKRADRFVRAMALEAHGRLIRRTPVRTGRARANWSVDFDTPAATTTEDTDKSGQATVARGAAKIARAHAGDVVYLTNALPYIGPLEKGSSKQAPAGMIAVTVAELQPLADQITRKQRSGGEAK